MRLLCNNFRCEFQNKCKHEKIDKLMRSWRPIPNKNFFYSNN